MQFLFNKSVGFISYINTLDYDQTLKGCNCKLSAFEMLKPFNSMFFKLAWAGFRKSHLLQVEGSAHGISLV